MHHMSVCDYGPTALTLEQMSIYTRFGKLVEQSPPFLCTLHPWRTKVSDTIMEEYKAITPILEAAEEAYLLYEADASMSATVSVGTGKWRGHESTGHVFEVMKSLAARTMNTEAKHDEFLRRYESLHDAYARLQEPDALGKIDLATSDKLEQNRKTCRRVSHL
ncbi:uncharacterized protein A1O5_00044 [Cladophialophora psammophila CBS 110553]|uniref:Uncharacterized protein n=1 Tax=Cladophialophora psammophila CBS 110553 TaxID=1182543 RepID=W9X5P5_9EURO|nr:uncharacterized protein A1O5_00044 [Cladophialophora psammophila CBS 110553]EXJ75538.1 hypothetical protein A1O5_00044 [Cladophialophora psammophila CBS 110553]